jgi:hypothetical protein
MTEQRYGPNTAEVERLLAVLRTATPEDQRACNRAWARVPDDVWYRSMKRARDACRDVAEPRHDEWAAVCAALGPEIVAFAEAYVHAAFAVTCRDQIDPDDFKVLVGPVAEVFGRCWEEEG